MISFQWLIATLTLSLTVSKIRPLIAYNFLLKIAAKALQMATWLLLTAYRKSPAPYPMVSSPTPYDLAFSDNTTRLAYDSALWPFNKINDFHVILKGCMRFSISDQ